MGANSSLEKRKFDRSNKCLRCKQSTGNLVIRHAVYCKYGSVYTPCSYINTKIRNCFIPFIIYKFRRALEPSVNPTSQRRNVLKPSGNLLIGFSGGLGSTVLLDLVHRCYYSEEGKLSNEEKGGKDAPRNNVWPKVSVCYVEVSEAYPGVSVALPGLNSAEKSDEKSVGRGPWSDASLSRVRIHSTPTFPCIRS